MLSPGHGNLRLASVRRLAREMADNGQLDPVVAAVIKRVFGVLRRDIRLGNWLTTEQANALLNVLSPKSLVPSATGAILALVKLAEPAPRRAEIRDLQQQEFRWVLPDLLGKGSRVRTVTIPARSPSRMSVDRRCGKGSEILDKKIVWRFSRPQCPRTRVGKLASHDLSRTCAKLPARSGAT